MNRFFSASKKTISALNSYNLARWMHFKDKTQIIQKKIKKSYDRNGEGFVKNKRIKGFNFNHEYVKDTKYEAKKHWETGPILYNKTYIEKNMLFPCTEELGKSGVLDDIFADPEIFLYKIIGMKPKLIIKSDKSHANFPYYVFCTGKIDRKAFIGRGHGKTVEEARNNACLYFISKIYEKKLLFDMIEENQIKNYDSDLVSREANAKLDILNYASCWLTLPKFEVSISYTKIRKRKVYKVTAYTEEPKLAGTGRSYDHRIAEILACVNFKKIAEEHLENNKNHLLVKDWENLNISNVKKFILFFEYKLKRGKTETIFKMKNNFWIASIKAGEKILAVSPEMYTKKDSEEACFLVYALNIRKEMPHLFAEYIEELKKGNGEFLRPVPVIPTIISDKSLQIMKETISQLKDIQTFENVEEINSQEEKDFNWLPFKPSLEYLKQRSETLLKQLKTLRKSKNGPLNDLFEKKQKLPIFSYKNNLLTLIKENPVCVVIGATGSGKTTQLPQFIFEDAILNNNGAECNILCTQPRRIATISVAQRVCFERNEKLQESIGYQVRFDNKLARPAGSINYCTTGILLRQLQDLSSSILDRVSHIIVDEVHERNIQTDFLLFVLKKIMKNRKSSGLAPIKIILMSATVDPTLFCKYFGEEFPDKQAPSIFIPGLSFPVSSYFLEDIYENLKNTFSKKQAPALFDKDTTLYLKSENSFNCNSSKEKEMGITKNELDNHNSSKDWPLKNPSNQELSLMNEKDISDGLIATTISYIVKTSDDGSILVFLPGYSEINSLNKVLLSGRAGLDFSDRSKYRIYMLHSAIPHMQQEVFKKLEPGIRKIILATNIAETSITIPDVVHVVDTCKHREKIYDQTKRITSLLSTWISHSNSKQRAGRAGRVKDGHYYALISKNRYDALAAASLPEMLRSDLQEICLQIKAIGMKDPVSKVLSETIEVPSKKAVENGLQRLYSLGALDENENLTPLGTILATLPVEPSLGKMCLMGAIFKCLDPILILAASASLRNIFVQPIDFQEESREARTRLSMDYKSDHLTIINCFRKWRSIQRNEGNVSASNFIEENFLHKNTLQTIGNVAKQILNILVDHKIISHEEEASEELGGEELNEYSDCIPLIRSLICAGFHPNIAVITNKRLLRTCDDNTVLIHPSSINFPKSSNKSLYGPPISEDITPPGTLYAFSSKSKTDSLKNVILRDTTLLNPLSVLLFGGKLRQNNNIIRIDDWIPFHLKNTENYIIYEFSKYMGKILAQIFNKLHIQSHHSQTYDILNENECRNIIAKGVVDALYANT
ncbi:hypothetical protein MERGE_002778 [Pneumocystis wakefieldiae]|uniref:RNA helicase n=1 Tax=Pneumocystis wakefieldiae TaxID=38082 RepID=A0A899GA59_9ASCO|nr:hypothetical protein MERGE_002778 [Pneumocystis wakefieldiae]